jgi:hypothetical protein
MSVLVQSLTRECQYCWDDQFGRSRCGRLATTASPIRVGDTTQITFRCTDHRARRNDTTLYFTQSFETIGEHIFGLGYNP